MVWLLLLIIAGLVLVIVGMVAAFAGSPFCSRSRFEDALIYCFPAGWLVLIVGVVWLLVLLGLRWFT